jgi:hypothetical protein
MNITRQELLDMIEWRIRSHRGINVDEEVAIHFDTKYLIKSKGDLETIPIALDIWKRDENGSQLHQRE